MSYSVIAVFAGSGLGALLRWWLGARLNPVLPSMPLGTLAANLIGGFFVGVAVAYLSQRTDLPREVRLFVITGFLGGLTTFSTFSSEVVTLIESGELAWSVAVTSAHLFGSLALTALGIAAVRYLGPGGLA